MLASDERDAIYNNSKQILYFPYIVFVNTEYLPRTMHSKREKCKKSIRIYVVCKMRFSLKRQRRKIFISPLIPFDALEPFDWCVNDA